jgi:hypothetical protein
VTKAERAERDDRARFRRMECGACGFETIVMGSHGDREAAWRIAFLRSSTHHCRTLRCRRIRIVELTAEQAIAEIRAKALRKAATSDA